MNELDKIRDTGIKTLLKNVHFDFDASDDNPLGCHIHYTTGAASLMDEAFLFKAKENELSEEENNILNTVNKKQQTKDEIMDEKVVKALEDENKSLKEQLDEIKKALKSEKIEKSLSDFPFKDEMISDVTKAMLDMSDEIQKTIVKAFGFLKDFKEEIEENDLQKSLQEEAGADGNAEVVEKSLIEKIKEARKLENK